MRDFALEVHFSRWEFAARHNLAASDAESMTAAELLALAGDEDRRGYENVWLGYTETMGAPDLREEIAKTYDALGSENILCFAGAEEGVYAAMRVLLGPGDHAVIAVPNYQAAETVPLAQCEVTGVALREGDGWRLDLDALAAAIRPATKLVSVNFPNNPTGAVAPRADFDALINLCRRHGLYLFSDEVYRLLETDESKRLPQAADVYEKALSLNVMSKSYGLPGLRIGWIASQDTDALAALGRYKHYLSICNSAPSERLALIALKAREKVLARTRGLVRANLALVNDFFADYPDLFDWSRPDGGCIAYPRFKGRGGVEAMCRDALEQEGVLLLPASVYRSELAETPPDRFRIGFGRAETKDGLAAFRAFIDRRHNDMTP
ncbi:MAG: aminotransferase class I/II-fold pyridoxal phosphate-dependent enzyme [Rhodospirillales bacterium]